jgi:hypothetical protein
MGSLLEVHLQNLLHWLYKIPLIVVNHMHVLAHFIDEDGYENQHSLFGVDYKWWTYSDFKVDHFLT